MKTTDLIPLILYELAESDKYGFELSKSIETLSNGKIVIKQATLYTILKKLEKSKFICSYWQDSEIGGKRHYYKLTQNGNLQLSTMPRIEVVLENILQNLNGEDLEDSFSASPLPNLPTSTNFQPTAVEQPVKKSIEEASEQLKIYVPEQSEEPAPALKEAIVPTNEVFESNGIDNLTENEINTSNLELLRNENEVKSEQFATNKNVSKFLESNPVAVYNDYVEPKTTFKQDILEPEFNGTYNDDIKFIDYVNFKQNPKYISSKKMAKNMLLKVLSTTAYLILSLIVCAIVTKFTGYSIIYYIFLIIGITFAIFYPVLFLTNYEKFRAKCQAKNFKHDIKKQLIILISLFLIILVGIIIANISLGKNSLTKIFEIKNFANLYVPIIISSALLADLLFDFVLMHKKVKN